MCTILSVIFSFCALPKRSPSYGQGTLGSVCDATAGALLPWGVLDPCPAPVRLPPGGCPLLCMWRTGLFLQSKPAPKAGSRTSAR